MADNEAGGFDYYEVEVDGLILDIENPRHEPYKDQREVIEYLCARESVLTLANDIVDYGLNPLEQFALLEDGDMYRVAEGNRRVCALKLLHDPDLAPTRKLRTEFQKLSDEWEDPIDRVPGVLFEDPKDVTLWLDRIHAGYAGGRGRKQWNAEQKARNSGYTKNVRAQKVLDAGEARRIITAEQRQGRISTVERYVSNPVFRDMLGLDVNDPLNVTTTLPEVDFQKVFKKFLVDVANKKVTTRDNAPTIQAYAHDLRQAAGLSGDRVDPRPIAELESDGGKKKKSKPKRPPAPKTLPHSEALEGALEATSNYKLQTIYYSLCRIKLADHTPLLTVGVWVMLETLTALTGRKSGNDFRSYLSPSKLSQLGLGTRQETKSIFEAVGRISSLGNTTKHDQKAASFNGKTLANDFETMGPMLVALARAAAS